MNATHGLLDLYGCDATLLGNGHALQTALENAAQAAGATILASRFHHFGDGAGVTGVVLLAESHISIHTWPEHGFAAVDIFLCGHLRISAAHDALCNALPARHHRWHIITRGTETTNFSQNKQK